MAKQIKALKCPQCGSVKKQEIKADHYICNNCGTEYFLDNDDININVKHNYNNNTSLSPQTKKILLVVVIVSVAFVVLSGVISALFTRKSSSSMVTSMVSSVKEKDYRDRIEDMLAFTANGSEDPVLLFKIERTYSGSSNGKSDEYFMRFYDPIKEKVLQDQPMKDWKDGYYLRWRIFSDGKIYICPDKSNKVYQIDLAKNIVVDVTERFFGGVPELVSGIATLDFIYELEGDGFKLMTNDGKEYYYYPLVKMLYKDYSAVREANSGLETLKDGAVVHTYYTFSEKSTDYKDEKIQLIKYWYKCNPGYPIQLSRGPQWHKEYEYPKRSGIFYGSFPFKKKLFTEPRVTKFVDLTPDRLYFEPDILYQDSTSLYIKGLPNANPESNPFVQKIDTGTGQVSWTYTPPVEKYSFDNDFFGYANGLVLNYHNYGGTDRVDKIVIIDHMGKVIKELDKDNIFN